MKAKNKIDEYEKQTAIKFYNSIKDKMTVAYTCIRTPEIKVPMSQQQICKDDNATMKIAYIKLDAFTSVINLDIF